MVLFFFLLFVLTACCANIKCAFILVRASPPLVPLYPTRLDSTRLDSTRRRVNVWDPAKWVSRVRAANTGKGEGKAPVLLRVSDSDGHHGPGNTVDGLKDSALEMAFLEKHLKACKDA